MDRQLFIRAKAGYRLAEAGRELLAQAEAMESAIASIEQPSLTADKLSGQVRIGATEGYGTLMLAGQLASLTRDYPHLGVDLLAVPRSVRLARHEADIVITLERPERGPYVITKLTDYVLRLYASEAYLAAHPPIRNRDDLSGHVFVSYIEDLLYSKELYFLDEIVRPRQHSLRSTSIMAQQEAVAAGAGLAILPAFSARKEPRLREVLVEDIEFTRTFWMLMPVENKDLARMRVCWDFLREVAGNSHDIMMGRA